MLLDIKGLAWLHLRRARCAAWQPSDRLFILHPMTIDPFTACGIVGAACFIVAYFATVQGWLLATDWRFPAANMLGALLLLVSLYDAWNLPSVVIECFWAAISLYGLVRSLRFGAPPGAKRGIDDAAER